MSSSLPEHTSMSDSTLFGGSRFWVSQSIPNRSKITEMIKQNGGILVPSEKGVDMKIVDPSKKNLPPGCFSYRYVEVSVLNGRLEDPDSHKAGPSNPRPMGASHIPTKSTRTDFTLQEDQILWDYLETYENSPGAPTFGNKIYQALAEKYPQHTWQSWRSRYTRFLRGKPRPGGPRKSDPIYTAGVQRQQRPSAQPPLESRQSPQAQTDAPMELKRKRHSIDEAISSPLKKRAIRPSEPVELNPPQAARPTSQVDETNEDITHAPQQTEPEAPTREEPSTHEAKDVVDALFLEMPFLPSDPDSASEGEEDVVFDESGTEDVPVESWVDAQVKNGVSDRESVTAALLCTSMDTDIALELLKTWSLGNELPHMRGVWTPEDDECLEGQDARFIERVLQKHGEEAYRNRWEYLSITRGLGLS